MARVAPGRDDRRLAEAAAWRVRLEEADAETSQRFKAWLADDPGNPAAWREAEALWAALGDLATTPELLAARRDALERARRASLGARARVPRSMSLAAGIAAVLVLAGALSVFGWRTLEPQTYRTGHGERRIVRLADGSRITLDSESAVAVRLGPGLRRLELETGQARFDVAHDASRPFEVRAGDRMVTATGTSFEVERRGPDVRVVLIEGHVLITDTAQRSRKAPQPLRLTPGERLTARADAPQAQLEQVDLGRVTAWQEGKLVFDDQPLSEVVQQVSLYTDTPVRVGDPATGALRISGVFRTGDLATFIDAVTRYLPLSSEVRPDGVVLRRRPAAAKG